ncbi:MAG: methyltransferase domain-containing protein [Candidatus Thiodiazotropha endolucinida]|nr:methyltransferase domain-containing protein [Candidatus Thiodiazotropha taylori]MCW4311765.1 methyltransferase domain-containing protein [Candidatus Thiodiazotropha taylori]
MNQQTNQSEPLRVLESQGLASVTLTARWSDEQASHEERLHVEKFSIWREADMLPSAIGRNLAGLQQGDRLEAPIQPGAYTENWRSTRQIVTKPASFDRHRRPGLLVAPRLGRFYPQDFFKGVAGIDRKAVEPARIIELNAERMKLDLNHPLARTRVNLKLAIDRVLPGLDRHTDRCDSLLDELLKFPGLATPLQSGEDIDFGDDAKGLTRMDDRADQVFYTTPRLIQHLDSMARRQLNALYRRLIPPQAEALDLMASFDSHLQGVDLGKLHLLGMNQQELSKNRLAESRITQDLNRNTNLPFDSDSLDAILCTAAIEYLTKPAEVLVETLRVLRPGGILVISFSNRWFPTKAIGIWSELHEVERLGMVTQWLRQTGYDNLNTFSARGWPRPADDIYAGQTPHSDPVYAAWGYKVD